MTHPCLFPTTVVHTFYSTRFLRIAAFISILIVCLAVTAVGQAPVVSGPLIFLPQVNYSEGPEYTNLIFSAIADLNGDGKLDIALLTNNTTVTVALGNGDGSFQEPQSYNPGLYPSGLAIADVNGDGKPDLVVTGCIPGGNPCSPDAVTVMLGNGDGSFKSGPAYSTGGLASIPAVADLNGDGEPDLIVLNSCPSLPCTSKGTLGVLLGKGDGTFEPVVTYSAGGFNSGALAIADVNGDGNPDLLVGNGCNSSGTCSAYDKNHALGVLLGKGDGTFHPVVAYPSGGYEVNSIAAIDLNGDGNLDIVAGNWCGTTDCTSNSSVGVLFGNGDGTFQAPTSYDVGGMLAMGLTVLDVNGDGKPDFIMTGYCEENTPACGSTGAELFALLGNGNGTFQPGVILYMLGAYGGPKALLAADLNGDGKPDLVLTHGCNSLDCTLDDAEIGVMLNNLGAPATTVSVASSKNPIPLLEKVTYTATVAGGSGAISGTVTFADGDGPIGTATLSSDKASFTTSYKTAGSHAITATYSGVFHSDESSRSVELTENSVDPTTTVLATSGSPTFVGTPVTFTATVTSKYGTIPNGELVQFYDGTTLLASVALSGGKATYTTSTLTAKTHAMKAIYPGGSLFATSTGRVTQVVELYATTTSLTSTPNPSSVGQTVTMTATVKSAGPDTPTGKVFFDDGTTRIGAVTLSAGVAKLSKSNLAAGTHSITATYGGDPQSAESTSAAVNQVVQ